MDRRVDLALAAAVIGFGALLFFLTTRLEPGVYFDPIGKQGLPYLLSGILVVIGGVIVVKRLRTWASEKSDLVYAEGSEDEEGQASSALRAGALMVVTMAYVGAWVPLGFLIATPLYLVGALWILGVRSLSWLVLAPVCYTAAAFLIFSQFLSVPLPLGPVADLVALIGMPGSRGLTELQAAS